MKPAIALWLLAAGVCCAAPLIDEPVAELRLNSGKVLTGAIAKSYTPTTVFIRHAEGGTSVRYEEFPAEYAGALSARRPAPSTAEQLEAQARLRAEAIARDAARPKSKPAVRTGPTMPVNRAEIGLAVSRIRQNLVDVELHNFGPRGYELGPHSLVAITSDGKRIAGGAWVGVDSSDRVAVVMRSAQNIAPGSPKTITVRFEVPADTSIASVEWAYPKS